MAHLDRLAQREDAIRQRMQRRLDQFQSGETRGHTARLHK
eukprot:SAG11_NODE_9607_length_896_cov_1.601004_2_plen_40_part_00